VNQQQGLSLTVNLIILVKLPLSQKRHGIFPGGCKQLFYTLVFLRLQPWYLEYRPAPERLLFNIHDPRPGTGVGACVGCQLLPSQAHWSTPRR
jgi:hypothetical protein